MSNVMTSSFVTQVAELQAWYFIETDILGNLNAPSHGFRRPEGDYRAISNPLVTNGKLSQIDRLTGDVK